MHQGSELFELGGELETFFEERTCSRDQTRLDVQVPDNVERPCETGMISQVAKHRDASPERAKRFVPPAERESDIAESIETDSRLTKLAATAHLNEPAHERVARRDEAASRDF